MDVKARLELERDNLTTAERLVATVVLDEPETVGFGTVAKVAAAAGTSPPTVVRLAHRLGFAGFAELQRVVQAELADRLSPAAQRIRARPPSAPLAATLAADLENVHATLVAVDEEVFALAVRALARSSTVVVAAADELRGVASELVLQLGSLRPSVTLAGASPVGLARAVAHLGSSDALVALDVRRYELAVTTAAVTAASAGATVIALSDSALSPLAGSATHHFSAATAGAGPFDSHVGFLSLADALLAAVATALRSTAARRLARIEDAWATLDLFL